MWFVFPSQRIYHQNACYKLYRTNIWPSLYIFCASMYVYNFLSIFFNSIWPGLQGKDFGSTICKIHVHFVTLFVLAKCIDFRDKCYDQPSLRTIHCWTMCIGSMGSLLDVWDIFPTALWSCMEVISKCDQASFINEWLLAASEESWEKRWGGDIPWWHCMSTCLTSSGFPTLQTWYSCWDVLQPVVVLWLLTKLVWWKNKQKFNLICYWEWIRWWTVVDGVCMHPSHWSHCIIAS